MVKRAVTIAVATVSAAAAAVFVGAGPAAAGSTSPTWLPNGYVVYSPSQATVNCVAATPVSVTWTFVWDATHLSAGPYAAVVGGSTSAPDSSTQDLIPVPAGIVAGTTGTFSQTLPLPGTPATDWTVDLSVTLSGGTGYTYEHLRTALTCGATVPATAEVAPAVSFSASCGTGTLTLDGTASATEWNGILFVKNGGFDPVSIDDKPGTIQHVSLGSVTPGEQVAVTLSDFTVPLSFDVGEPVLIDSGCTDTTPPTVTGSAPTGPFTLASSTRVAWHARDAGGSGLASYQVRYRRAAWNGGFGSWVYPTAWRTLAAGTSSVAAGLASGYDYCYSVRAADHAANTSPWSAPHCVARALDDRALAADRHWRHVRSTRLWNGTGTQTTTRNAAAARTGTRLDRFALVATTCRSCGSVAVYVGATRIARVSLASSRTHYRVVFVLPRFRYRTGTVTIKVLTGGKLVQVDGFGISRT